MSRVNYFRVAKEQVNIPSCEYCGFVDVKTFSFCDCYDKHFLSSEHHCKCKYVCSECIKLSFNNEMRNEVRKHPVLNAGETLIRCRTCNNDVTLQNLETHEIKCKN